MNHPSLTYAAVLCIIALAVVGLMSIGVNYLHTQEILRSVYSASQGIPLIP